MKKINFLEAAQIVHQYDSFKRVMEVIKPTLLDMVIEEQKEKLQSLQTIAQKYITQYEKFIISLPKKDLADMRKLYSLYKKTIK